MRFIRTTDHLPTDLPTGRHQLTLKQKTRYLNVLRSLILQNFHYQLVYVITK